MRIVIISTSITKRDGQLIRLRAGSVFDPVEYDTRTMLLVNRISAEHTPDLEARVESFLKLHPGSEDVSTAFVSWLMESPSDPVLPDAVATSGFTDAGTDSYFYATSNIMPALESMTVCVMFRLTRIPVATVQRLAGKSNGSSIDWSLAIFTGRVQMLSAGTTPLAYRFKADDVGKVFILHWTRDASGSQLYITRAGDYNAERVAEDLTVSAPTTNAAWWAAIGAEQLASSGTGVQPLLDAEVIGVAYSPQHSTQAQVQAHALDCVAQSTVATFLPGATHCYQAVNGLENDQIGSGDMVRKDAGGNLSDSTFAPVHNGDPYDIVFLAGQSLMMGPWAAAGYASVGGTDFTVPFPACQMSRTAASNAFADLDDSGASTRSGCELSLGRQMVADGLLRPHVKKYALGSKNLAVDFAPPASPGGSGGPMWNGMRDKLNSIFKPALGTTYTPPANGPSILDQPRWLGMGWGQGESDGNTPGWATAYQANLDAFITAVKAEWPELIGSDWTFAVWRLSMAQTNVVDRAVIRAAQDAVALARPDTVIVDQDALTFPDNLHANESGLIGAGFSTLAAILTQKDQKTIPA